MEKADFTCKRCGGCCGVAYFTKAEYKALRRTAEKLGVSLVKQYIEGKPLYVCRKIVRKMDQPREKVIEMIRNEEIDCPFLGKDKDGKIICRIYEQRPEVCRLFGARADLSPRVKCPNHK